MGLLTRTWAWITAKLRPAPKLTPKERDELAEQWADFNRNRRDEFEAAYRADRGLRSPVE